MKRFTLVFLACLLLLQTGGAYAQESIPMDNPDGPVEGTINADVRSLKAGDKGDDVTSLQMRLRELLYYTGPVSGTYAQVTAKAVKAVQEAYGLPVNGIADAATQEVIFGEAYRPLARGSKGEDVKRLQTRLSELGYYWGQISGNYLDGSTAAIGKFQRENDLPSNGKADVKTQERLYSDDIAAPTVDPAASPTPVPAPTPQADLTYPGRLTYGSKNNGVERLQTQLKYLGFFDRKVTSGFYQHTQKAVKDFQRLNGLDADGVVAEDTWNALFAADAVRPGGAPKAAPAPTLVPYFVEVDVANQLIKVFKRDENQTFTMLHKIFTASTGTDKYPSDVGTWTMTGRRARWAYFPTWGGGYAQYWVRITADIAFHSVLYENTRLDSVKMSAVKALGKRASHGCIRLTVADAKWMYENVRKGVQVWIHEDALLDPELKYANRPGAFNATTMAHSATPAPTVAPVYQSGAIPSSEIRTLKVDSQGEDVFWLQSRLRELGYYQGSVTGQFREGTRDAVKAYQRANRLSVNGQADKNTLELIYRQALAQATDMTVVSTQPILTPAPTPDFTVSN